MRFDARATLAGFLGAIAILLALSYLVGVDALLTALARARLPPVLGVLAAAAVWLVAWALALRAVLSALAVDVTRWRASILYAGVLFANNVTPFGQAGGEPISALLIADAAGATYETALAAIASADTLNFLPSITLALLGVAYLSTRAALGDRLRLAATAVVVVAVVVPAVGYLLWTNREWLETAIAGAIAPIGQAVGRAVPRLDPPARGAVEDRLSGFVRSLEVVATDRDTLLAAAGFATIGWLAQATALWLALYAVGVVAPVAAVAVAVPVGAIAGVTPLPGGLGGIEAVLVALLVPLAGVAPATAAAAVVVHRGAIYWLPTLLGAAVVSAHGAART